jgi:hypothetical protein
MPQIALQNSYFFENSPADSSAAGQPRGPIFCVRVDITSLYKFAFMRFAPRAILYYVSSSISSRDIRLRSTA